MRAEGGAEQGGGGGGAGGGWRVGGGVGARRGQPDHSFRRGGSTKAVEAEAEAGGNMR